MAPPSWKTISVVEDATLNTRKLANQSARLRREGKPEDVARNWALIRLMWVWRDVLGAERRDVLGAEPTIYLRTIRENIELDEPEPQNCMAFVVANLAPIDPVAPGELPALERHLQELRSDIPTASLLRASSRANREFPAN